MSYDVEIMDNAIVYLVRSSRLDVGMLNESLNSLEQHLFPTLEGSDLILFVESNFYNFKNVLNVSPYISKKIKFYQIDLQVPVWIQQMYKDKIKNYFPHPTHSIGPLGYGHPGFTIGYRSMCRFFSGAIFRQSALRGYKTFMRLDCDSKFIGGQNYSLFDWFNKKALIYSYIESAVQNDNEKVTQELRKAVGNYIGFPRKLCMPRTIGKRMFYTNFEIGNLDFFRSDIWLDFYDFIDDTGGFYINRWGDAPLRFAGLWAIAPKRKIKPIPTGFTYFHGDFFYS